MIVSAQVKHSMQRENLYLVSRTVPQRMRILRGNLRRDRNLARKLFPRTIGRKRKHIGRLVFPAKAPV